MSARAHVVLAIVLMAAAPAVAADDLNNEVNKALLKVQEDRATAKSWDGKNADQPYVTLLNEYETRLKPDYSYEETYHTRVRIQKPEAKELGQWPIYYNKRRETITDVKAFVETPQGQKLPASKIEDADAYDGAKAYADMKVKVITLPNVEVGSILDMTVKSTFTGKSMPQQFWDQVIYPAVPAKYFRHSYVFPESIPLQFRGFNDTHKPLFNKKDGIINYSYTFEETEGLVEEEFMPPLEEITGNIYGSTIKDWNQIADWYRDLMKKNTVDDPDITIETNELVAGKSTQKDRARAIIEYIQDNFKYVPLDFGNSFIEPHPTPVTFKNRYADSKDIALVMKQMLELAGVSCQMVLMRNETSGDPRHALPNPDVFEHVLIKASIDGQDFFLDPLTKGFDFGQYPSSYDNAYALVIEDTGSHFENLPIAPAEERILTSRNEITVFPDGSAQFKAHVQLPLEASQAFRSQWAATPEEQRKKFFENLQNNFAGQATMMNHKVTGLDKRYGPIELDLEYKAAGAYPVVNDMLLLKETQQSNVPEFAEAERHNPIFIPGNSIIKNTNVYHVPEGYKLDFLPQPYSLISDFMDIMVEYTRDENTATVNSSYKLKRSTIPAKTYPNIKKFCDNLFKKNEQYIVLKQNSQINPQAKEWVKGQ